MGAIAENLQATRARLERSPGVTLLAVSKSQPLERIREAAAAGRKSAIGNHPEDCATTYGELFGYDFGG